MAEIIQLGTGSEAHEMHETHDAKGGLEISFKDSAKGFWDAIFWWEVVGVQDAELRLRDDIQQLKKLEEEWKEMVKLLKMEKPTQLATHV